MIGHEHIQVISVIVHPEDTASQRPQLTALCFSQYGVPVIKYDRNGFKPRARQLVLTQTAAHLIDDAKVKQRVLYTSLKGQGNVIHDQLVFILGSKCL